MFIKSLHIENYRTLESVQLKLGSAYTAVCGANDCGKTNVVNAIRAIVKGDAQNPFLRYYDEEELNMKDDFPKWKEVDPASQKIVFRLELSVDRTKDIGFYQSVTKQLSLTDQPDTLNLVLQVEYGSDPAQPTVTVDIGSSQYTGLVAEQVLKALQSSRSILFHNSTGSGLTGSGRSIAGHIREITGQHDAQVTSMRKTVNKTLARISKTQQAEFEELLGRLRTKYRVGLSLPTYDFGYIPFSITLGDAKIEVPLDEWGSGTRNRTLVLLTLFRASQISKSAASASKITPVIIVEEPESFLHPSAQAEFGRILQDLAEEFQVQVLVTTHSPYLLNLRSPGSNILLERKSSYKQLRETVLVDTSGDNWMAPFAQALGLDSSEFKPWKGMMLTDADNILLVEGDLDKEYLELLKDTAHGSAAFETNWDIVPYDGTGALSNSILLRFVKNRFRKFFVTFDLDENEKIEKVLKALQLEKGKNYQPVGLDVAGKRSIEGLLPESIRQSVFANNPEDVQQVMSGTKEERESAKRRLKRQMLDRFKADAKPGTDDFKNFYALVKVINKAARL